MGFEHSLPPEKEDFMTQEIKHTKTPERLAIEDLEKAYCKPSAVEMSEAFSRVWHKHSLTLIRCVNESAAKDAAIKALTEALEPLLGPKPQEDWSCHKGITTMAKCGHCSRVNAGYAALSLAKGA